MGINVKRSSDLSFANNKFLPTFTRVNKSDKKCQFTSRFSPVIWKKKKGTFQWRTIVFNKLKVYNFSNFVREIWLLWRAKSCTERRLTSWKLAPILNTSDNFLLDKFSRNSGWWKFFFFVFSPKIQAITHPEKKSKTVFFYGVWFLCLVVTGLRGFSRTSGAKGLFISLEGAAAMTYFFSLPRGRSWVFCSDYRGYCWDYELVYSVFLWCDEYLNCR